MGARWRTRICTPGDCRQETIITGGMANRKAGWIVVGGLFARPVRHRTNYQARYTGFSAETDSSSMQVLNPEEQLAQQSIKADYQ